MMELLLIVFLTLIALLVSSFFLAIMLHASFHNREETQPKLAQAQLQVVLGNISRPLPSTVTTAARGLSNMLSAGFMRRL